MAGGWRRLHNGELHILYFSPNVIRLNKSWSVKTVRAWSRHGRNEKCIQNLRKFVRKRPKHR
jgi:hypothetical protein